MTSAATVVPKRDLILASSSPYRRALLRRLRQEFTWESPDVDEVVRAGERPRDLVRRLSLAKARAVAGSHGGALVIGGDQVAVNGARMLGKPGGRAEAIAQLEAASGRTVRFLTGVCVLDAASQQSLVEVVPVDVVFRPLSRVRIEAYVDAEEPWDCAGSFKCEGLGIALFERIVSEDPTALTGLPLITLTRMLEAFGIDVLAPG